jgi:hypothetical protein
MQMGRYRHYKGIDYEVLDLVCHCETLEWMVLYKRLYERAGPVLLVRPYKMFIEDVDYNGKTMPRFEYIGDV